jgi:hypothetical protein
MESLVSPLAREGVSFLMHAEYADLDICSVVSHANGKWSDGVEAFRLL